MDALTMPLMMTPMDVGLWLSLPTRQVERMARRGQIPCLKLPTGEILFDRAELLMWLDHLRDCAIAPAPLLPETGGVEPR